VDPGEDRLRQPVLVLDADATERVQEDPLDRDAVVGVEPVAGQEHQAREVPPEPLATDEEAQPLAFLEPQDAHGCLIELVLADLEQLVARVVLQDREQVLGVVARPLEAGTPQDRFDLAVEQGDLGDADAV
jgi:hypothetical protein